MPSKISSRHRRDRSVSHSASPLAPTLRAVCGAARPASEGGFVDRFGCCRDAFEADLIATLDGQHTVQEFKAARAARRLKSLAETGVDPGPVGPPLIEKP